MPGLIIEACCGSADDVIETRKADAHHVKLDSDLSLDGPTLSLDTLKAAKTETGLSIMAMTHPRESAFPRTTVEFRVILLDAGALLANGADGIAFGFLNSDGTVDANRCREMLCLAGKNQIVFHCAIDVVSDWWVAINLFYELGITRILTDGQRISVFDGTVTVIGMIHYAHGRIETPPGGGIRMHNVQEIVSKADCTQTHISPHQVCLDPSALGNPEIYLGLPGSHEDRCQILDADEFEKVCSLTCAN